MTLRYQHFFPLLKCGGFRFFIKVQYAFALVMCPLYSKFTIEKFYCIMFLEYCQLLQLSLEAIRTIRAIQLHLYSICQINTQAKITLFVGLTFATNPSN